MKTFPLRLPDELHRLLKSKSALAGKAMNEVLIELIEKYVKSEEKVKSKK
jgi:predicted HicB family RNase H-like nuclease